MVNIGTSEMLIIWVSSFSFLLGISLGFDPPDNYLIACGSPTNISVADRLFLADLNTTSYTLSTPQDIVAETSSSSVSSTLNSSALDRTARIFKGTSRYTFSIKQKGRHWIRLHFFPFVYQNYNMSRAKFSVSSQNFVLIREPKLQNGSPVKEYCLNITSNQLVLTFTPSSDSFAFINALEVFSLPEILIPEEASAIGLQNGNQTLSEHALETVARVNMGNLTVLPQNDTLWRLWVPDGMFLRQDNLGVFDSNVSAVNFTGRSSMEDVAPASVYGTASRLNTESVPRFKANLTWRFDVDNGFQYLVRLHFCDILSNLTQQHLFINVYINSEFVRHLDLASLTSNILGVPYFMDVVTRVSATSMLNVSVGPSEAVDQDPTVILNGLEIMKINNPKGSLDALDAISSRRSKKKLAIIIALVVSSFIVLVLAVVLFFLCRRKRKLAHIANSRTGEHCTTINGEYTNGTAMFSRSKFGYRFPFSAIQEATDNFSENLVIGVGGFGKVYKGVLGDETQVAVKRGVPQSNQGLSEFRTEIEMLSQFRHRHLVSLIGYCDERDEMIIIYEYMENGTLKGHLYGSKFPRLSWRQRLEICIGSARGLHYLHTGSAKAIIHRDVKSANILLDENLMAKVADFGLSKTGPEIDKTHVSTAVKGSFGYLDPEYLTRQQLTEKSDVYSFGVVMFEVLCGRPVIDPTLPREKVNLIEWAMKLMKRGKLEEIVDPSLVGQIREESLRKFAEIAEKCLAEHGVDRPSTGDVLWNLECALQLQGNEGKSNQNGEQSQVNHGNQLETIQSSGDFSMASVCDLAGVSMSKVFAQMVREETR